MSNVLHRPLARRRQECNADRFDAPAVLKSLDTLLHYHMSHTSDTVTKWRDMDAEKPTGLIVVTTDPRLMARLEEFLAPEFADGYVEKTAGEPESSPADPEKKPN